MNQEFTDEQFEALSRHVAALNQQQQTQAVPAPQSPAIQPPTAQPPSQLPHTPRVNSRMLAVGIVGGGLLLLMGLGAIAGFTSRPTPQATASPSPSPVTGASPSPSPSPTSTVMELQPTHIVWGNKGDLLNIRNAPDGDVIGEIPAGTAIAVTGTEGRWAMTNWQGVSGYVSQKFLIPIRQDKGGR